jgi:chromosome segregation ATPase
VSDSSYESMMLDARRRHQEAETRIRELEDEIRELKKELHEVRALVILAAKLMNL